MTENSCLSFNCGPAMTWRRPEAAGIDFSIPSRPSKEKSSKGWIDSTF